MLDMMHEAISTNLLKIAKIVGIHLPRGLENIEVRSISPITSKGIKA